MPAESKFDNLTDGTFVEWKIYMEALLTRKQLLPVVDGTERHPGGNEGTKKVREFYRKQAEARAEIILHVSPSQLVHCSDPDPYIIWTNLLNIHLPRGRSTVLTLRRRFHRLRLEKTETISSYISRLRHVAFLLEQAAFTVTDDDMILALTAGLPHSYDNFLVSLDTLPDSEYTLTIIISRLNNEYQRQHMYFSTPRVQPTLPISDQNEALAVVASPSSPMSSRLIHITCFLCGNKGHYQANCPTRSITPSISTSIKSQGHAALAEEDSEDEAF